MARNCIFHSAASPRASARREAPAMGEGRTCRRATPQKPARAAPLHRPIINTARRHSNYTAPAPRTTEVIEAARGRPWPCHKRSISLQE
eukprot:scaffold269093_cov31-Tisochrysis_lutea.AAC.1